MCIFSPRTACPFNSLFLSQQFAYEMLRQGNLRKEVQDKRMNLKNTDEHAVLLGYMTIFNVGLAGGKAQPTNQGSKVAVPTSKLKDGKALDVERIPDEKMLEYDFDMWLNAIDKEEKLKHWWLGLNNRWVLSYHDKAGSASEPLDHF